MGILSKRSPHLRRLACLLWAVVLGSILPDVGRFFRDQGQSHNPLLPFALCWGVVAAYFIGWLTKYILKRGSKDLDKV